MNNGKMVAMRKLSLATGDLDIPIQYLGARGSVVVEAPWYKPGSSWVRFPMRSLDFPNDLILPAAQRPWGRFSL
jgi:hypothetical protein